MTTVLERPVTDVSTEEGAEGLPSPVELGLKKTWIALDTETTSLEWAPDGSNILLITLWWGEDGGAIVDGSFLGMVKEWVTECLKEGCSLVLQNSKFDLHQMGLDPASFPDRKAPEVPAILDTAILAHLLDSRDFKNLENLESKYLGTHTKTELKEGRRTKDITKWPEEAMEAYAINDARVTLEVARVCWKKVKLTGCEPLYRKEERYLRLLWAAERRGVRIDIGRVQDAIDFLEAQKKSLEERLYELATPTRRLFNWQSHPQLSKVLYEEYRTPEGKPIAKPKNPYEDEDGVDRSRIKDGGKYNKQNTSSFLLLEKAHHPLGSIIAALRETSKLVKVLYKWLELAHHEQGYATLHTSYNMTGTRTGRLSSTKPQLQNVAADVRVHQTQTVYSGDASHRVDAYNLRRCIVARDGYTYISVDHKQQEGRLFGIISNDPVMRTALEAKIDIHKMVAKLVWGIDDDLHREWAKTLSFGMIYGMTKGSLQHRLNKTQKESEAIENQYLTTFPRIRPFLKECVKMIMQCGYVRYWSGRYWREDSQDFAYKSANALVQGGSADLISVAALRCQQYLDNLNSRTGHDVGHFVLHIHDELIFEVLNEYVDECVPELLKLMEVEDLLGLPFVADAKVGPSFGELKKYGNAV